MIYLYENLTVGGQHNTEGCELNLDIESILARDFTLGHLNTISLHVK